MTSDACAIGAATLANDGVCPLTGALYIQCTTIQKLIVYLLKDEH